MKPSITYAATFYNLINLSVDYLTRFSTEKQVIENIIDAIERFEKMVSDNPKSAPISPYLSSLGMMNYREFTANDFRILYRVEDEPYSIKVVFFCSQKQDLTRLLVDYCLLYK
ncbi:type II toxin-antitoxin system RelE/ParE family toxin [Aliiglaciecola litoralis]|uniref:Type II toxin-antitoxin system RelE/ParE family toxin n=1 Tax=Aliiglaciecola litoralis TaxID=582857 RepID=A0ABN1LJH7_9ALTE